jgi:WD40 repeat protein
MATYYFGSDLTWDQYLRTNLFVQDSNSTIRKSGEQTGYTISEKTKQILANNEALSRTFQQDYDQGNSTLAEGFGVIGRQIEALSEGIEHLGAAFEYGMSLLAVQVANQDQVLDIIEKYLDANRQSSQTSTLTQARESYYTGRDRLRKGLLDKALEAFLKAEEQNDLDFLTQYFLGYLYLYGRDLDSNVIELVKAEKHFRDAARYAKIEIPNLPEARQFCGAAYFHASIACYVQANEKRRAGDIAEAKRLVQEAADLVKQATDVYPELTESFYQSAKTCALLGEKQAAIQSLEIAVKADPNYCLKASVDRDFGGIHSEVQELFEMLHHQAGEEAKHALDDMRCLLEDYIFVTDSARQVKEHIDYLLKNATNYYQSGTYFDYLDILTSFRQVKSLIDAFLPDNLLGTFKGHSSSVRSVSFSQDGRYLASGSSDNTVRLWEVPSGKELVTLRGHVGSVFSVSFSPDARYLLSRSSDRTIRLWEIPSGEEVAILQGHMGSVHSSTFSPDGQYLASGSSDNTIGLWQTWEQSLGRDQMTLRGHTNSVNSVVFSRDGRYLASGSSDDTVRLWEIPSGKNLAIFDGHAGSVYSVSFSPDGQYLASGSDDDTVRLWEVASGKLVVTLHGHEKAVCSVSFSPDGRYLASRGLDQTVRLWEVSSGREITTIWEHQSSVYSVVFSPNGRCLALGSWDDIVWLWEIPSGKKLATFPGRSVCFSSDGRYLASGTRDGTVRLWGPPMLSKQEFWRQERRIRQKAGEYEYQEELTDDQTQQGLCLQCGAKLGFFDRLLGQTKCKNCR